MMNKNSGDRRFNARELLGAIKRALGADVCLSDEELLEVMQQADALDPDSSGSGLELEEFLAIMSRKLMEVDVQNEIVEAFRVYDRENTGFV